MKPIEGNFSENAVKYGVSGINVDGCRIETSEKISNHSRSSVSAESKGKYGDSKEQATHQTEGQALGRFPSNVIVEELDIIGLAFPDCNSCNSPSLARPSGRILGGRRGQGAIYPNEIGSAVRFFKQVKG